MPFWKDVNDIVIDNNIIKISREDFFEDGSEASLRDIVSIESGLWKFCFEKGYTKKIKWNWLSYHVHPLEAELDYWANYDYQYRLLESALIPEQELAKFLLENIKL